MKKIYTLFFIAILFSSASAQITVASSIVPQYVQGKNSTNNNRVPFWFRVQLTGLTPGATYRFYAALDTANASPSSNGAGNPYLINMTSGTFRRSTNASLSTAGGYDSLMADNTGSASAWMGVEPTANGRFTPGFLLYPKIMLNNGAGGTSVATRVNLSTDLALVLNFGTTSMGATQGSALYDSADVAVVPPKSFAAIYDNTSFTNRPLSFAVVEEDAMYLRSVSSVASFYRTQVDSTPQRWGTIIPNANTNGVRGLQYLSFAGGTPIASSQYTDADGTWCGGAVTTDPSNGGTGLYLGSLISCVGIKDFSRTSFVVSPNPSSGSFVIKTNSDEQRATYVLNALGEVILSFVTSEKVFSIDLGSFPRGMYWIKVSGHDGSSFVQKVLIQ